jgi:hypothetical protein
MNAENAMQDRRKLPRRRTYLGGCVTFNQRHSTLDCLVRNLSAAGAKIAFPDTATAPDHFDLNIRQQQRTVRARIAWRRGYEAGVVFYEQDVAYQLIAPSWSRYFGGSSGESAAST